MFDTEWVAPKENGTSFFVRAEGQKFQHAEKGIFSTGIRDTKTSSDASGIIKRGSFFFAYRIVIYILNQQEIDLGWSRDGVVSLLYQGRVVSKAPLDFALITSRKFPSELPEFDTLGWDITLRNEPRRFDQLTAVEIRIDTDTPFKDWVGLRCVVTGHLVSEVRD